MATNGWIEFNGVELVNLSRTVQLSDVLGLDPIWDRPEDVDWIQDARGGVNYDDIAQAPWYDSGYPASSEFAGIVPLSFAGLDDSTLTSQPIEYITDGGHSGKSRNAVLPIVVNLALMARTERGAEYGRRWLDRMLKGSGPRMFCSGSDLRYYRYADASAPLAHRRDVRITRGSSVTRKRKTDCSVTWLVTFTLTAADPYEYGEPDQIVSTLSSTEAVGPAVTVSGDITLTQEVCPEFDYTPITDPLNPGLVESPTAPDFYPNGWDIVPGQTFQRFWVRTSPTEPSPLLVVPEITITTDSEESRMVRISIWAASKDESIQCDPLFAAVVQYIPANVEFTIDGEQKAVYVWDGVSDGVRRADGLVYGPDAEPLQWTAFNDASGLLIALDLLTDSSSDMLDGGGAEVAVSLIPKSD
jgi:hypothetical protein